MSRDTTTPKPLPEIILFSMGESWLGPSPLSHLTCLQPSSFLAYQVLTGQFNNIVSPGGTVCTPVPTWSSLHRAKPSN